MHPLADVVRELGGLAATFELHAAGFTRPAISAALQTRRIIRVRQGWYAEPGAHPELLRSARVGGRATCSSALHLLGFWVVTDGRTHLVVGQHATQLRSPRDSRRRLTPRDLVVVHWRESAIHSSRLMVDEVDALVDLSGCATPELLQASTDSVLHRRPELRGRIQEAAALLPLADRLAMLAADGVCESGTETLFWRRLRRPDIRRQVWIPGVGRIDFLLGARLVIEVDGEQFHDTESTFEHDRHRDALLSSLGYRVLRFSYHQVMFVWDEVRAAVLAAVQRGDHL